MKTWLQRLFDVRRDEVLPVCLAVLFFFCVLTALMLAIFLGALDQTIVVSGSRTEHSVELSGLSPETR